MESLNPHRPVGFINEGPYHATVTVAGYRPDPLYTRDPRLFPFPSTVSFAPSAPYWPNPSRFLSLPVGGYSFCYYWTDKQDKDKDGYFDMYHTYLWDAITLTVDMPTDLDLAPNLTIHTDLPDAEPGDCGRLERDVSVMPTALKLPTYTPMLEERAGTPSATITLRGRTPTVGSSATETPFPTYTRYPSTTSTPVSRHRPTLSYQEIRDIQEEFIKRLYKAQQDCTEDECDPAYSTCALQCSSGTHYIQVNVYHEDFLQHDPDYRYRVDPIADYVVDHLVACNNQFLNDRSTDRKAKLDECVYMIDNETRKMLLRVWEQSCSLYCSEEDKTGELLWSPLRCYCKDD